MSMMAFDPNDYADSGKASGKKRKKRRPPPTEVLMEEMTPQPGDAKFTCEECGIEWRAEFMVVVQDRYSPTGQWRNVDKLCAKDLIKREGTAEKVKAPFES